MSREVECIWPLGAQLGEGPIWDPHRRRVAFVDILGKCVHSCDASGLRRTTVTLNERPGFLFPTSRPDTWVLGMERSLHLMEQGVISLMRRVGDPMNNRINDGMTSPSGDLWFGTMDAEGEEETGRLYRLSRAHLVTTDVRCAITNGPAISPDGRLLYHVDTKAREIQVFDIMEDPLCANARVLRRFVAEDGDPDGAVADAEGCLWVAMWGGWCVLRLDPDGRTMERVEMPCAQPTKVAFGGPQLDQAFVTTARTGLRAADEKAQPLAGGLFRFTAPVKGLPLTPVRLD